MNGDPAAPRYVVVSFGGGDDDAAAGAGDHAAGGGGPASIAAQGTVPVGVFGPLFLDRYGLDGERHHPGRDAVLRGVLLAIHGPTVVTVPIWRWTGRDGAHRYLCQATEDGSPPALSVLASSHDELIDRLRRSLRPTGG